MLSYLIRFTSKIIHDIITGRKKDFMITIKSKDEIELMRHAGKLVSLTHQYYILI